MYEQVFGVCVLPGYAICHHCDVRACANPGHLFVDTRAGNVNDMDAKGRRGSLKGEAHPMVKLTEADVAAIRASRLSVSALSRLYGVHRRSINRIQQGVSWAHPSAP